MTKIVLVFMLLAVLLDKACASVAQGLSEELWNPSDNVQLDLSLDELVIAAKASAKEAVLLHKRMEVTLKDMLRAASLKTLSADFAKAAQAPPPPQAKRKLAIATSFTCESFTTFSPWSMCSDVVDYAFLVETSSNLSAMEAAARGMLPTASLGLISHLCLDSLKRKVCADIYRPCVSGGKYVCAHYSCLLFAWP